MDFKYLHRAFAAISFVTALIVYLLTVQPTVPFWDCGEFSAASIWQQVPHPPGAPLFLMIGKLFHLLIPFGDPGWRLNLASVMSSAFVVLLTYLIIVMILNNLRKEKIADIGEAIAVYGSGLVGALALIFSDTFWFNAVESEVYSMSTLFVAILIYLMMRWNEVAEQPGNERYLLLMAYLIGLSTGVHLLAILMIFGIVFIVYFRKYQFNFNTFLATSFVSVVIFFIVYPGIVKYLPALLAGHTPFRNEAKDYIIEDSMFLTILAIGAILVAMYLLWDGLKKKNHILNLMMASFLLMVLGYTTYTQILLRSNANPPMNENEPKNFVTLTSYLGREQYGDDPLWPRRIKTDTYYSTHYHEYGQWNPPERKTVRTKDGTGITVPVWDNVNVGGELNYLWSYQVGHMYMRYFGWNFIGRTSDVQDAGVAWFGQEKEAEKLNYDSGYKSEFPIRFWALPLLLGLFGLFFHASRDSKMFFIYLITFLLTGVLAAIAQQQQHPQPRERDYFYSGSFMIWCMWIGVGIYGLMDFFNRKKLGTPIIASIVLASTIAIPVNMAFGGWKIHSRAGNYLPFDYSYNILQSTEENAIVFTNGDNDTFPVWYLQDVSGVRRDVRIVNLSLGNTLWYVDQLKNRQPWGSDIIPLSFSDDSLKVSELDPKALSYDFGEALNVSIPVDKEILSKYTDDPNLIDNGTFDFTFVGKEYQKMDDKLIYIFRVQDKLVLDILRNVRFERPVYYSITVGQDAFCGLEPYFRYEGMAMRICPVRQKTGPYENMDIEIMSKCLLNIDNSDNFSKTPKYGFKMRNLNNMNVYYDEVHRRLMLTYRHLYTSFAQYMNSVENNPEKAIEILDVMNKYISTEQFPLSFETEWRLANLYKECNAEERASEFYEMSLKSCMELINNPEFQEDVLYYEVAGRYIGPHRIASQIFEQKEDFVASRDVLQKLLTRTQQMAVSMQGQENQTLGGNIGNLMLSIEESKIKELEAQGEPEEALAKAREIYNEYANSNDQMSQALSNYLLRIVKELEAKLNPQDTAGM